jgi:predicted nucleic acid-binding protein
MVQVIDTSIAIKWFVREEGQDAAFQILEKMLTSPGHFAVPELFYFELANVFNRLIPHPNPGQLEVFDQLINLGIHRFVMTSELAKEIRIFQKMGLSGYDATYVGLAKILKGVWLSFDKTAHRKIAHLKLSRLLT